MGGNPIGHVIPGVGLLLVALNITVAQILQHRGKISKTQATAFGGFIYLVISSVGMGAEIVDGASRGVPFSGKEHMTMYAVFSFAGFIHVAEALRRLPEETWRASLGLAMSGVGLMFYVHSQMQMMEEHHPTEGFVHWLLSVSCFAAAASFFLSWAIQSLRVGFIFVASACTLHQSFWFFFLAYALYSGDYGTMGENLSMGNASAFYVWMFLVAMGIVAVLECSFRVTTTPSHSQPLLYAKLSTLDAEKDGFGA